MSRGGKSFTVAVMLRNNLLFFGGTVKDTAPCASLRGVNSSLRCCSASVWLYGDGSCLCPPSGQYVILTNSLRFHLKY